MGAEHPGLWALRISSKWSTSSLLRWKPDLSMFAEGRSESAVYWLLSFKLNYMMPDHQINVHPYRPPNHPPVCWTMLTLTTGNKVSMLLPALGTLQYLFPRLTLLTETQGQPGVLVCIFLLLWYGTASHLLVLPLCLFTGQFSVGLGVCF